MVASNRLYKIRCIGEYPGFTVGDEYLGHLGYGPLGEVGMNTIDDDGDRRTLDLDNTHDFKYIPPVTCRVVDDFLAEQEDEDDDYD